MIRADPGNEDAFLMLFCKILFENTTSLLGSSLIWPTYILCPLCDDATG